MKYFRPGFKSKMKPLLILLNEERTRYLCAIVFAMQFCPFYFNRCNKILSERQKLNLKR